MVTRTSPLLRPLGSHLIWLALFALVFAPTVLWLVDRWTINIYYNGHGIFVPLIVAWLVRENLRNDPITEPQSSAWGFLFLAAGLGMLVLDTAIKTQLLGAIGLVVCLPGLSLLLLGAARTRKLAFPLVISAFMLPVPAGFISDLHLVLRHVSAIGSEQLIEFYGIPILRDGTRLVLPYAVVHVADACSGVSTLLASVLLGMILAHSAREWSRKALLLGTAIVLAIICNVIRVAILTLIVHYYGVDPLNTPLHEISGVIVFALVLVALFFLADRSAPRAAPA